MERLNELLQQLSATSSLFQKTPERSEVPLFLDLTNVGRHVREESSRKIGGKRNKKAQSAGERTFGCRKRMELIETDEKEPRR